MYVELYDRHIFSYKLTLLIKNYQNQSTSAENTEYKIQSWRIFWSEEHRM